MVLHEWLRKETINRGCIPISKNLDHCLARCCTQVADVRVIDGLRWLGSEIRQEKRASYQSCEYQPQLRPGCERHEFHPDGIGLLLEFVMSSSVEMGLPHVGFTSILWATHRSTMTDHR